MLIGRFRLNRVALEKFREGSEGVLYANFALTPLIEDPQVGEGTPVLVKGGSLNLTLTTEQLNLLKLNRHYIVRIEEAAQ